MKAPPQQFCTSSAAGAKWTQGLRKFFEYRDLGISEATGGAYDAHVIRVKKPVTEFPHTGPHLHDLEFQMIYILKGWIRFTYEGQGEFTFREGDSCLQPARIVHDELACSDDLELIEFTAPADFNTHRIEAPTDTTD